MTDDDDRDYQITEAMLRMGGSFVRALAMAYRVGDHTNRHKLKAAFPDYWQKYAGLSRPMPPAPSDPRD